MNRRLSIAYVNGLKLAIICSQYGIKDNGASAVLENSIGKFMSNVSARNSMCPGSIKAKPMLMLDMLLVINRVTKINT